MVAALCVMQLSLLREANMSKYKNDYPEPEDDISLEDLLQREEFLEREEMDRDQEALDAYFLEPDDGEELNFEDKHRGWR